MQQYVIIKNLASDFFFKMQLFKQLAIFENFQFYTKLYVLENELISNHSLLKWYVIIIIALHFS